MEDIKKSQKETNEKNEILSPEFQNLNIAHETENTKKLISQNDEKSSLNMNIKNKGKKKFSEILQIFESNKTKKNEALKPKPMHMKTLTESNFLKTIEKREKMNKESIELKKKEDEERNERIIKMRIRMREKELENKKKEEENDKLLKEKRKKQQEEQERQKKLEKEIKEQRMKEDEEKRNKKLEDFNQEQENLRIRKIERKREERRRREEEERQRREEEERRRREEEERQKKEEEERRKKEEEERQRRLRELKRQRKFKERERQRKLRELERQRIEEEERQRQLRELERKKKEEEEKKKKNEKKKLIIENQNNLRKKNIYSVSNFQYNHYFNKNNTNNKLNQTLEDMCNYGNIINAEIENDKKKINKEFLHIEDLNTMIYSSDQDMFALNLLAQNLASNGIKSVINKNSANITDEEALANLQFIVNGLYYKTKYILRFDFGEEQNEKLLEEGEEYDAFIYKLKQKLSRDYKIRPEDIIITYPERGSFQIQVIFQSDEFNQLNKEEFENKFRNEIFYPELRCLKTIHSDVIMGACKLSKSQLDPRGNRSSGWGVNENRGNKPYYPPLGWIGIGLNVMDKYENNIWIGMSNSPGEWCVAYHGVGNNAASDKVKESTGCIIKGSFRPGRRQAHKNCQDKYHNGTVGEGVYCTPFPATAEGYAGISEINGKKYKTILMVRVKPEAIRNCYICSDSKNDNYWVVNGTTDEIRAYRILYKEFW